MWLNDYFTPTVESIEKHVMAELNAKFNQQLQKWFEILIEDPDLHVRVDEEFSPVVERGGYEQEYLQLSGGERTSVALAYRLALNTTVQEISAAGGSNLLILDEPTDGFSREQLFKIREILAELKCPQVVMVSHERELEGFSDHVFKVEKIDGISQVSAVK
jgi:exonuclease SbcC